MACLHTWQPEIGWPEAIAEALILALTGCRHLDSKRGTDIQQCPACRQEPADDTFVRAALTARAFLEIVLNSAALCI